jgi:hypothetical protein
MSRRRPRIPGTPGRNRKTLFMLPGIRDDDPVELKNALAIRNACATKGRCPACGVVGEVVPDEKFERIYHYVFMHEPDCPALTDEAA